MNQALIKAELQKVPKEHRKIVLQTMKEVAAGDTKALTKYKHMPVDVETFINDPYYMNAEKIVYPVVKEAIIEVNEGDYDEVVCTGGIGSGKSTLALYTQAYQLYLLSCMANPHEYFGLDPSSEILMVFQSLNKELAEDLDYARFKTMIKSCKYFEEQFSYSPWIESQLEFPNRIVVKPVSGAETGAIGQNVIGGLIDEINFMAVIENAKAGEGGTYDQATALYNSIARRRKSRFMKKGRLPGRLCLVSSRRHPGQFTDVKEEEAKVNPRIYIYDKRVWEVKPDDYSGEKFPVFIGDEFRKPRVLNKDEEIKDEDRPLIDMIPIEYWNEFAGPKCDLIKSLRDIAGKSTLARYPFIPNRDLVSKCFNKRKNVFAIDCINFVDVKPAVFAAMARLRPNCPRWVHIDLGLTSDSAGIVIGHVPGFREMNRGDGFIEQLPIIELDGVLEVEPPAGGEIDFASIRRILYRLRDMGLNLKWASLDSFQSVDTMQILRQQGFVVGYQSIDTTNLPYDVTKQALYDGRVVGPEAPKLIRELLSLEKDLKRGKIDHPAHGSKDLSDALAGVTFGLTTRREIWAQFGVPITQAYSVSSIIADKEHEQHGGQSRDAGQAHPDRWRASR